MSTTLDAASGEKGATRARRWGALTVLMLPVLLVSIDNTVLTLALPQISLEFSTSGTVLLWVIDIYSLVLAGLLVTMGALGDRVGRRRLLLIGASGFALVSVLAAFAPTAQALVAARAALGIFGATLMPATLSLIRNIFEDRQERRLALAVWASCFAAGAALGPMVAGILLEHFHWGSVFLIAVPLLVPMLLLAPVLVPESRDPHPGPAPVVDSLLSMVALSSLVYTIKHSMGAGLDAATLVCACVALASGWLFVHRQLHRPTPMLDLSLFARPAFSGAVLANLLGVFSMVGFIYYASQHAQLVIGLSPLRTGVLMLPGTLAMVVAGLAVVPLVRHVPVHRVVTWGLCLSALGHAMVGVLGNGASALLLGVFFMVISIGSAATETLTNDAIISAVPASRAGAASAISETAYEVGAVLGTAVLGGILVSHYRAAVDLPDGLDAAQASVAGETLGGAVSVAGELPTGLAEALLESAHRAFDSGVSLTGGVGAVVMLVAAVLAARLMGRGGTGGADAGTGPEQEGRADGDGGELDDATNPVEGSPTTATSGDAR